MPKKIMVKLVNTVPRAETLAVEVPDDFHDWTKEKKEDALCRLSEKIQLECVETSSHAVLFDLPPSVVAKYRIEENNIVQDAPRDSSLTYGELIELLATLTPEQRAMPATYSDECHGNRIRAIHILAEDHVDFGDGLDLKSAYSEEDLADLGSYTIVPAGTPFIEGM